MPGIFFFKKMKGQHRVRVRIFPRPFSEGGKNEEFGEQSNRGRTGLAWSLFAG